MGGSADLASSNKTLLKFAGAGEFEPGTPGGRNVHFGIREHAMAAAVNGLTLSKLRAFGSSFLIFTDYARPAIRLSAIMELPTLWVFTHDAMGDGEDGPTHQPVEQLISLRAIPGLVVIRPADANEVVEAYRYIMQLRHQPALLALTRQVMPTFDRGKYASAAGVSRGAYVMADPPKGTPELILIASGSEVALIVAAHETLAAQGIRSRVVSMSSWDIFEQQPQSYRDDVLPPTIKARVAVEQGSTLKELDRAFGFEPERVVAVAMEVLGRH
jgi:transketolase